MSRKILASLGGALAATALLVSTTFASVTFDPSSGTGFVGKGDVQSAFGWNNPALQANANNVSFSYITFDEYSAVCTWTTGEGTRGQKTHNVSHTKNATVNGKVAGELRKNSQLDVNGFNLTGFGTLSEGGDVPVVGGACPGNPGHGGTWSSVELVSSSGGGLYANYGGASVLLWGN